MKTTNHDLTKVISEKHEKKWVALSKDCSKVISFNDSLVALKKNIGDQEVVYMKIPPASVYLSF